MICFIFMLSLIIVSIFLRPIFRFIYPLIQFDKWERKYAKVLVQKKHYTEIQKEFDLITNSKQKEEKLILRKQKLEKLKNEDSNEKI